MNEKYLEVTMWLFIVLGSLFFLGGLYRFKGPVSVTYLHSSARLKSGNYLAIPVATLFWLLALIASPLISSEMELTLLNASLVVFIVLAFLGLKYLKPKWLRWLEEHYQDLIPELESEIRRIGPDVWDEQINTQAELEVWVYAYLKRNDPDQKAI